MVIRLDRWVRRRWLLATVFFAGLLMVRGYWEISAPNLPASGQLLQPVRQVSTAGKPVVLTFNIAWGQQVPMEILEQLQAAQVRATFFVSGPWAVENVNLLRKMVEAGHDVGTLGHQTVNLASMDRQQVKAELSSSIEAITSAGAPVPVFFRPPGGAYNDDVLAAAHELGLLTVLWSVDARDWLSPGTDAIVAAVARDTQPGSIVLLHASDHNRQTVQALKRVIDQLRQKELNIIPLSAALAVPGRDS